MGVPSFNNEGHLPLGRYSCSLNDFEDAFVTAAMFEKSESRTNLFADLLAAIEMLNRLSEELVESIWCGGGFASAKLDPSDIDVTFILNRRALELLPETDRARLKKVQLRGGFKQIGIRVDGFFMTRDVIPNPWSGQGNVTEEASPYLTRRGAWDDWWGRSRVVGTPEGKPLLADAIPRRGYVEVIIGG